MVPVSKQRVAIRFLSISKMNQAIQEDHPYQYRHLVMRFALYQNTGGFTRREVCEAKGIPINAISRVVDSLIKEGALVETGRKECNITGVHSRELEYNHNFKGPY